MTYQSLLAQLLIWAISTNAFGQTTNSNCAPGLCPPNESGTIVFHGNVSVTDSPCTTQDLSALVEAASTYAAEHTESADMTHFPQDSIMCHSLPAHGRNYILVCLEEGASKRDDLMSRLQAAKVHCAGLWDAGSSH